MQQRIAIVTDSTAYLEQSVIDRYNITVIPLVVTMDGESYREGVDIGADEFYDRLPTLDKFPTTSQPAIGDFIVAFGKLAESYDHVISIHLSGAISGTYNSASAAGKMVDNITVHTVDSGIACYGLGFMVIEAAEMAEQGKSVDEIIARVEDIVSRLNSYFIVDDLSQLHQGGRLNAAQFLLGSMLKIKPILTFEDKRIVPFEKIRTRRKAIDRILEKLDEEARSGEPINLSVIHSQVPEDAEELEKTIIRRYPHIRTTISYFGPVIGAHTGSGTLGISWYKI